MNPKMWTLLIIAILFTAANVALITFSRRNKRLAEAKYQALMTSFRDRTMKGMKKRGLHFDKTYPLVSDTDEGYLLCLDTAKRKACYTDKDRVRFFSYDEIDSSELLVQSSANAKFIERVEVQLNLKTNHEQLLFPLLTKKRWRNGVLGKYLVEAASQLNDVIQQVIVQDETVVSKSDVQAETEEDYSPNTELESDE